MWEDPNYVMQSFSGGWTPCHEAASNGDDAHLYKLLKHFKHVFQKNNRDGNTPLHEAAKRGYSRCIIVLCETVDMINTKTNINLRNSDGFSALHLAAQNGHNQCCRELLMRGSSPHISNNYGDTPLHTACRYGHAGVARILLSAFSDCNKQNNNGDTPLHIACAMGRRKIAKLLIKSHCKTQITNIQNDTPMDIASRKQHNELLRIICSSGSTQGFYKYILHHKETPNDIVFSPYGCQSLCNSRHIFLSYLEPVSKLKLGNDEQYFFDLAGNLNKGPKCLNKLCYCEPVIKKSK
ncbi:ankyrin repeat domain-containing protein 6 [Musca domestica]|uniref:Ankyrin repeat domain-containing protein 6 n=1 Tax=Musca domestica TaxID=7370 RepID=A0ABM3V5K9_MUSDO|nr:ankyrin repeat domain-containing protein 6 [Musca domestica]